MSKICGIIGYGAERDGLQSNLDQMVFSMKHQPWHRVDTWQDKITGLGHLSIGAVNEQEQPLFSADGSKAIVFAGKIFGYEDEKKNLEDLRYRFRYANNDAEFVLHIYEEFDDKKFKNLNGIFAFSIWDRRKKQLILVNDRYGMRPMYYCFDEAKKTFYFSSELKSISGMRQFNKKINWDAWNVFLRLGFLIDDDTFFRDIHVLPQASILKFDLNKLEIDNYWDCDQIKAKEKFDELNDVDNLVHLFKQSMRRRVLPDKKVAVFLSGGPDSSGIAAELKSQKVDFTSYTTRKFYKLDEDQRGARFIADLLDIENKFSDLPDDYLEIFEPIKNSLLDYQCSAHAWLLPLLKTIPSDTKINFDGLGFDFSCDTCMYDSSHIPYRMFLEARNYRHFIQKWYYSSKGYYFLLWPRNGEKNEFIFLSKHLRKKFSADVFLEKVRKQLVKVENTTAPYVFFHLITRARRCVAASVFGLMSNWVESFCPYMDNDFFDYLMSLPLSARTNRKPMSLRAKILSRAFPELFKENSPLVGSNSKNFARQHPDFYRQTVKNLGRISLDFAVKFRPDVFQPFYLLPRIAKDIVTSRNYLSQKSGSRKENLYNRLHHDLIPQLYMLNSWLEREKIKKVNYD